MKILRRSVTSIGRSRKVSVTTSSIDDDGTASTVSAPTTATETKDANFRECDDRVSVHDFDSASSSSSTMLQEDSAAPRSKSDSGSPISVLPSNRIECALSDFEAFRFSYSRRRLEGSISKRTSSLRIEKQNLRRLCGDEREDDEDDSVEELDPYPTEAYNSDDNESRCSVPIFTENLVSEAVVSLDTKETIQKDWSLVHRSLSCDLSEAVKSPDAEGVIQRGWPLMHRSLSRNDFNLPFGQKLDRSMSVVNWALQLPKQSGEFPERVCISKDFRKGGNHFTPMQSDREEFSSAQVRLSFSLPHVSSRTLGRFEPDRLMSLTSQIHQLYRGRPRIYTYEELDAATSSFSPSMSISACVAFIFSSFFSYTSLVPFLATTDVFWSVILCNAKCHYCRSAIS
jgi:hypothetical protein